MKKVLSLLLAVMMVVSLCPVTALADGELLELQPIAEQEEQIDEQPEEREEQKIGSLDLAENGEALLAAESNSAGKNNGIFTVQLENGTEVYPEKLHCSTTVDPDENGTNYKVDYVDGFWKVVVPEGTSAIKISLDNLKNTAGERAEPYAYFAMYGGAEYINGEEDSYKLCPFFIQKDGKECFYGNISYEGADEDLKSRQLTTEYKDGFYTIPFEEIWYNIEYVKDDAWTFGFLGDFEGSTINTDYKYASIYVGTFTKGSKNSDYDCYILVQIGGVKEEPKNNGIFTVQLENGTEVYPEELAKPESITWGSYTYPKDITYYEDGIWKITVPAGTSKLKFSVDNLKNLAGVENKTDYAFFATWRGSLQGGVLGGKTTHLQIDPDYLGAEEMNEYGITTLPDYKDYCYETEYEDGFYTIPLEQLMRDPADMKDVEKQVWGEFDSQYKYAVVFIGTHDKGRPVNGYDTMVLVQIGGDEAGENTPPVRKSDVPASTKVNLDESLKCTIDLSNIFYDADGDELTYKVRIGEEGKYVPIEGSSYTYTFDKDSFGDVKLYFTANDGKTDGGSYIVYVKISAEVIISYFEAIVADPSDYWTEDDRWNGTEYTPGGFFRLFKNALSSFKADTSSSTYRYNLIAAYGKLMPKTKVNATRIYDAAVRNYRDDFSYYTEVSVPPYIEAQAAAIALYADGAIANEAYTEEKQAEIYRVYDAWSEALYNLVWKESYKTAFEYYQSHKAEAEALLKFYNPSKYNESDYTAESWQAFVSAWNDLKADVDFVFDEESGTAREWNMLKDFEKHMKALPQAFADLVSAIDITISFKYIENMHFRYTVTNAGTSGYVNPEFKLAAGATTLEGAFNAANISLYSFNTNRAQVKEGMTLNNTEVMSKGRYALFINGTYTATGTIDALKKYQLHNNDDVVVARITAQYEGGEASSGYDSTTWSYIEGIKPTGYENSVGLITINSVTQNAKVGDSVTISASAKSAYEVSLGKKLDASGLTLLISEPSEENTVSQSWKKTLFKTNANGTVDYVFTEPGYYTVAIVNNKYDEPTMTNIYGAVTVGTYNTLMIGDFTTVYVAPADDQDVLVAEWRAKNLAEAKEYFEQYRYYDFNEGFYEDTLVPMYEALIENQNNAKTFKELIDTYNSDFVGLKDTVEKNIRNHEELVTELRGYLRYIPEDVTKVDSTYKTLVKKIQSVYGSMNDYERNLLSDKEKALAEKIMLLDPDNLPTEAAITVDVQIDASVVLGGGYGWLTSAPNENCVYAKNVGYGEARSYYKWTTGTAAEPSDDGMTARPGDRVHARRLVVTNDNAYWMVFSYDGGKTWNLSTKVDGGEGMFSADFTMPKTDESTLVFALKMISKAEYEEMKLNAETPEMLLEEAKATYKAALEEAFAAYDKERYTTENYTSIRYAKEDGINNIDGAKTVTAVVKCFNAALDAMKAVAQKAQVYVEVKNDTFTSYVDEDGETITAPWTGTLVAKWVNIDEDSTMMTCIADALKGHTVIGAENNYISSIDGLGEFGGGQGSGWMGTLNEWFTNYGFGEFSVANGRLKPGDRICVMYTCNYGGDIGGAVEGNTDTTLKELSAVNGTISPEFGKETLSYLLTMDEGKHTVMLNYTASNKAFQVRTYLNQYTPSSEEYYSLGETISVKEGDIIYVACGDPAWPSMAGNDALKIIPHVYAITVVGSSGAVRKLIEALPEPEKLVYSDKDDVDNTKRLFDALNEEKKAEISGELQDKLEKCVARIADLEKVNEVEKLIAALPDKLPISDEEKVKLSEAKEAFDALGEELQKDVRNVYVNKLQSLLGRQKIYFDYNGGTENTKMLFTQDNGKLAVLPGTTKENFHFDGWYTAKNGGTQITIDTIFTESCKLYAHWLDDVQYTEKLINTIGEVTLTDESKAKIDAARSAYDNLTDEQKELVNNYNTLTEAEEKYAELVAKREADEAAAKAVDELVDKLAPVTLESEAAIKEAREAFDALTPAQKEVLNKDTESKLVAAEKEYNRLVKEAADKKAAKAVDELVNKLAPVTLESGKAIEEARKAFDALTPEQKQFLDKDTESELVAAENEYHRLVKEAADKAAAKEVEDKIAALQPVTKNSGDAIKDARSSYDALTPEQKELVSKEAYDALVKAEKAYSMIVDSNKPDASDKGDKTGSVIKISANASAKGEQNPNTGAPAMSVVPAMLVLAAAVLMLKKRG